MTVTARIRFTLAAVILAAVYYHLLVYLVGLMSAHQRPGWWLGVFPARRMSVLSWVIALHTAAVLCAALPIAVATVVIARTRAVLLALIAAVLATAAAAAPSLSPTLWPLIWNSHPIFFVTDQAKLVLAVPFIAWVLRAATSNNRFGRSRIAIQGDRIMKFALAILSITVLVGMAPPVRGSDPPEAAAESAALAWLALVDAGNYSASWTAAATLFRQRVPQLQWQAAAANARAPFGALKSRKLQSATFTRSLPGAPDGEYVVVKFASSFENKAGAVETVTPMVDADGTWRVSGYYIR